ncbi:MAG: hypothetical protein HC809_17190 [Gammaproteobacteria bacterium]|nr:hypothetical protein [Gammaproteobacteria bacterium]
MTVNTRPHALIIGASVAGLGAALALAPRGYRITCVERDHTPLPQDHLDAARTWQRRGASQTRHSHVLLAPLVNLIDRYAPDLLQRLIAAGAEELGFEAVAAAAFDVVDLEPGDEEIRFLACRRWYSNTCCAAMWSSSAAWKFCRASPSPGSW